jgi:hypothetical protein
VLQACRSFVVQQPLFPVPHISKQNLLEKEILEKEAKARLESECGLDPSREKGEDLKMVMVSHAWWAP